MALDYISLNTPKDVIFDNEREMFEHYILLTEDFLKESYNIDPLLIEQASVNAKYEVNSILQTDTINFEYYFSDFNFVRSYTKNNNKVSDFFLDELEIVYLMGQNNTIPAYDVKEYVNNVFLKNEWTTDSDIEACNIFVEVFYYSYDYWISDSKLDDDTWVIIHDGMRALLGCSFGPAGSIILGTAFSAYSNEVIFADN